MTVPAFLRGSCPALVFALASTIAGCASGANDMTAAERHELSNMPEFFMVPPTRPAALVASFRRYCVETPDDIAARSAMLRAADYVPMGGWTDGKRSFVVQDRRPMVILSESGRLCAVRAKARSGQDSAIRREIAGAYPDARVMPASENYDAAWETVPDQREVIALIRTPGGPDENEFTIALMRR